MIGRFQANKLADFLVKNQNLFTKEEKASAKNSLEKMGVVVEFEESSSSKAAKQLSKGNIGYVITKTWAKLTAGAVVRQEIVDASLRRLNSGIPVNSGFAVTYMNDKGKKLATAIIAKTNEGGKINYEVGVGTGLDIDSTKQKYGRSLVALAVAAFTAGERKLADFAALKGDVANYLVSGRDGLVLFYPDGTCEIKNIITLKKNDIRTPGFHMENEPLEFRNRVDDFNLAVQKIKKAKASAMQGQLLVYDGGLQLSERSSGVQDKRRALAIMKDGSYALIDFELHITLLEEAVLGQKMGVKHLVNLDTGMYDFSQFIDKSGKVYKLGTFDSERPTNLIVFYSGISGLTPTKLK
jgi:hypothetical protein